MSPDGFFREKVFFVFLNSPCYETPKKRLKKKSIKNKNKNKNKNKVSNYFFFSAAANVRHFRHFFFRGAPCPPPALLWAGVAWKYLPT
jgi:hypothetical protein